MTDRNTPSDEGGESGALARVPSGPEAHPDGPLFATEQSEAASATDAPSPYPWDEPGEPESGTEAGADSGPPDELPATAEIFDPAAKSAATDEDQPVGIERLNENIEQLLETVDAVAADVAESRSKLECLTQCAPDDPEVANGAGGIEDRIRIHTADFHRWIEKDRRRRRWWPAVAAGIAAPAALLLGLLVEQQYQVIPLHDPTGGWGGHIWEQYGRKIVDCAVEARRTGAEVNCPLTVRRP